MHRQTLEAQALRDVQCLGLAVDLALLVELIAYIGNVVEAPPLQKALDDFPELANRASKLIRDRASWRKKRACFPYHCRRGGFLISVAQQH